MATPRQKLQNRWKIFFCPAKAHMRGYIFKIITFGMAIGKRVSHPIHWLGYLTRTQEAQFKFLAWEWNSICY